jgi:YhcH/YjgK/YiaL family protein
LREETKSCIIEFIKNNDLQTLPCGKYDLGDGDFVNIFEYETKENDNVFETHKAYVDIHYVIIGTEKILWADKYLRVLKSYQADGDYSLGTVNEPKELTQIGDLCVFLPDEPHKAGVILYETTKVKKAVFKIKSKKI